MNEIEKATIVALTGVANLTADIGQTQFHLMKLIAEKLPNLNDAERKDLLARTEKSQLQLQQFQEIVRSLKAVL